MPTIPISDASMRFDMKAAVLFESGSPLQVHSSVRTPELGPGQVLVKLAYSGVCHSQLMEVRGNRGVDAYLPHLLGHEGSGVVVDIGRDVKKLHKGQKVVLGWMKGDGCDVPSTQYSRGELRINSGAVTTFSEYSVVSENRCLPLPEGVPMDVAVLFGCAIPTGAGIVTNTIKPAAGSRIAVYGLGGIGMSALMACKLYQCGQIIAVDISAEKLDLAREFGATDLINARDKNPLDEIMRLTGGKGVDYSIESSGLSATIEQAFGSVRRGGGLCVFASHPKAGERISLDPYELICGKRIMGSWGGGCDIERDVPRFAALYRQGSLHLEKLITKRYKLEEINQALDDLEAHKVGRPLIEIDPSIA